MANGPGITDFWQEILNVDATRQCHGRQRWQGGLVHLFEPLVGALQYLCTPSNQSSMAGESVGLAFQGISGGWYPSTH